MGPTLFENGHFTLMVAFSTHELPPPHEHAGSGTSLQPFSWSRVLTRAEMRSPTNLRFVGWGRYITSPPPLSNFRTTSRSAKHEAEIESSQRGDSNAILEFSIPTRSNVSSRSGQSSKLTLFALSAAETRPQTATRENSTKMLLKG